MMDALEPLPLEDIKVVEFAQMVAGPSASLLLADYGADVIKVEPPEGDGGRTLRSSAARNLPDAPIFVGYNRNKRLTTLDLRTEEGLRAAWAIIAEADVLVEASRPGVMDRLGLGAEAVLRRYPRLIYAAISGFGDVGPGRDKRGVDLIVQAESGIMSTTGLPDLPLKVGFTMVDAASGHALCHGILAALFRRERTGRGGVVRTSLYEVALHLQTGPLAEYLMTGVQTPRAGNSAPLTAPADLMRCAEGAIVVSAYLEPHWRAFVHTLGADVLLDDPRFRGASNRVANRGYLLTILEAYLAAGTSAQWRHRLQDAGVLVGEVKDYAQVVADPCTIASGIIERFGEDYGLRNPINLSGTDRLALRRREEGGLDDIRFRRRRPGS